jgi:hypothetical protein
LFPEFVPLVASVPPLVGVSEVVLAAAVQFETTIPQEPSGDGVVPALLFIRCMLKVQFWIVLLLDPSPATLLNNAIPNSMATVAEALLPSVNVNPSMVTKSAPLR